MKKTYRLSKKILGNHVNWLTRNCLTVTDGVVTTDQNLMEVYLLRLRQQRIPGRHIRKFAEQMGWAKKAG